MSDTLVRVLKDNAVIQEVYSTFQVADADGTRRVVQENVTLENAEGCYRAALAARPARSLEIGMANGITTLAILEALADSHTDGTLVSVDPFQSTDWKSVGRLNVERSGFADRHRLMEAPDYLALPSLLGDGERFDFAYIDGWHNFEYVLLDFFYIDKMLEVGGVVGFNDCDWKTVIPVLNFVTRHRQYEPVDVGLPARYGNRADWQIRAERAINRVKPDLADNRLLGPLRGRRREDRYFRKLRDYETPHGFWRSLDGTVTPPAPTV